MSFKNSSPEWHSTDDFIACSTLEEVGEAVFEPNKICTKWCCLRLVLDAVFSRTCPETSTSLYA